MDTQPVKVTTERECPFCEGKEALTPQEVYAVRSSGPANSGGWKVRAIQSLTPMLSKGADDGHSHADGIYDMRAGVGRHEIIVETPQHGHDLDDLSPTQIEDVLRTYAARIGELEKDPQLEYALLFKNHGLISGAATDVIRHSRSQLVGLPIIPKRTKEELQSTKN